jgi:Gamma-thionin family
LAARCIAALSDRQLKKCAAINQLEICLELEQNFREKYDQCQAGKNKGESIKQLLFIFQVYLHVCLKTHFKMKTVISIKMYLLAVSHLTLFPAHSQAESLSKSFSGICKNNQLCEQACIIEGYTKGGHCNKSKRTFLCHCRGMVITKFNRKNARMIINRSISLYPEFDQRCQAK